MNISLFTIPTRDKTGVGDQSLNGTGHKEQKGDNRVLTENSAKSPVSVSIRDI